MRTALVALCGLALLRPFDLPQGTQPTFKSTTELVEIYADILDKNGNFVPGLKAENITIYENGKPQKIQQFFMVTNSDVRQPTTRPLLPRISSSESGFFFCGIRLEPLVTPSPSSSQPNSSLE